MKIIDTFLFSEPHEDDLLYIKFRIQEDWVDEYIILENAYTFQGEYKGHCAEEVLSQERFAPFRDKVHLVSKSELLFPGVNEENTNFKREFWQRGIALPHLLEKYGRSTEQVRVIVDDTDELIDFSDPTRRDTFLTACERHPNEMISFSRLRYWYDFDNKAYLPNLRIPTLPLSLIVQNNHMLNQARMFVNQVTFYGNIQEPVGFEYSYVFRKPEDLFRKKHTYSHTGFTDDCVLQGLRCNHWPRPEGRPEKLGNEPYDFFETIELTPENSPTYVRENLAKYKTNIVDPNYRMNRLNDYGADNVEKWTCNRNI